MKAQSLPSIADKFIDIDNVKLAYKDSGEGQVILCLHAVGHSSSDFSSLYTLPLERYRVIAIDFPGHGASGISSASVSATYFTSITHSFIQKLGLKNIIIVGNSIGGATALRLASSDTNVKALALADPGGLDKGGFLATIFLKYMVHFFKSGQKGNPGFQRKFEKYYQKVLPSTNAGIRRKEISDSAYQIAPFLVQAWESFGRKTEDLRPLIQTITCPVLFTWGMRDKIVQYRRNKKAIDQFNNHKLIKYPIGHTPYVECPDVFLKDFRQFLDTIKVKACETYTKK